MNTHHFEQDRMDQSGIGEIDSFHNLSAPRHVNLDLFPVATVFAGGAVGGGMFLGNPSGVEFGVGIGIAAGVITLPISLKIRDFVITNPTCRSVIQTVQNLV